MEMVDLVSVWERGQGGWVMRAWIGGWGNGMEHEAWRWVVLGLRVRVQVYMGSKIMIMRACDFLLVRTPGIGE